MSRHDTRRRSGTLIWMAAIAAAALAMAAVALPQQAAAQSTPTVSVSSAPGIGSFLVAADGLSLYIFTPDAPGVSNCSGGCAEAWPPLTVEAGARPSQEPGVSGALGVITRDDDGSQPVTYNDQPLYFYRDDAAPGDINGQGVGDVWYLASTEGITQGPLVKATSDAALGDFLVDADGLTLYIFSPDPPNASVCTGGCLAAWPPLLVDAGVTPAAGLDAPGALGVITLDDGSRQVTYRSRPLYYFARDEAAGDTKGQSLNDIWWVAAVTGTQQTAALAGAPAAAPVAPPAPPAAGNAGVLGGPAGSAVLAPGLLALAAVVLVAGARARTARTARATRSSRGAR